MGRIERFEDIQAWQKARELNRMVYCVTGRGEFARDFALRDQIRRAAISVMLNIAEGFARRGHKEFAQFLYIAHGSAAEVQSALYIALDQCYIDQKSFDELYQATDETSRMIAGFLKYLEQRTDRH